MRRNWICILVMALLMTLVSAEVASAKKSRPSRGASRSQVKRDAHRGRASRKLSTREKRIGRRLVSGRRGRYLARSRRNRRRTYVAKGPIDSSPARPASSGIPAERVTEIQNALIKAGYMDGPASGQYDETTIEAMKQFQAANRLPQTGLPSAPALKKLGVSKRSNDGYAVPVTRVSESEKTRPPQ